MDNKEIKKFGFKIYRLKEANEAAEFLLVDTDKKKWYQYSYSRGVDMLKMNIEKLCNAPLKMYMVTEGYLDIKEAKNPIVNELFRQWVLAEIKLIDNINYKPIDEELYKENDCLYYNLYRKSNLLLSGGKEGNFPKIEELFNNICGFDAKGKDYFFKWLAWQIQNPERRLATSIVLQGEQGSGKTLLCNYVFKPIFDRNFIEISQGDLQGDYAEYIMGKQLIVANEVMYNDRKSHSSEKLKNYVSDDFVNIQRKYKDSLYIRNYSQWIFTSNNQIPIRIEKNDRRFTVFKSRKLKDGVNFFMEFQKVIEQELEHFIYYLRNIPVTLEEVNYPYLNIAKKDIIEASLNSVELFMDTIIEEGGIDILNKFLMEQDTLWHNNLIYISRPSGTFVKLDGLYQLYLKFCQYNGIRNKFGRSGFTSNLKHLHYTLTIVKDDEEKSHRVMKLSEGIKQ